MKLTPWFPGNIKPAHVGVYQQYNGTKLGFQYWNGRTWSVWDTSVEKALDANRTPAWDKFQNDSWRGVRRPK